MEAKQRVCSEGVALGRGTVPDEWGQRDMDKEEGDRDKDRDRDKETGIGTDGHGEGHK